MSQGPDYTRAQLPSFPSGLTLASALGNTYKYTNLGYETLCVALSDSTGADGYSVLLNARLTGPLGMSRIKVFG